MTKRVSAAFSQGAELHTRISKSTLHRRLGLNRGKLQIIRGRRKGDVCPVCQTFDSVVVKACSQQILEIHACLMAYNENYWVVWDAIAAARGWSAHQAIMNVDASVFLGMDAYISSHGELEVATEAMQMAEAVACTSIEAMIGQLRDFKSHFQLRDFLAADLARDLKTPQANNIYLWEDFEAHRVAVLKFLNFGPLFPDGFFPQASRKNLCVFEGPKNMF